jgi:tetratricopeptide (TPR) repeat protein
VSWLDPADLVVPDRVCYPDISFIMPQPLGRSNANSMDTSYTVNKIAIDHCERGRDLLARGEYNQARSAYQLAIDCQPELGLAQLGLARVYYRLGDFPAALAACDRAIACDPSSVDSYYQRALVAKSRHDYALMLADCGEILERCSHHHAASGLNAISLVKSEEYTQALPNFDFHLDIAPEDPYAYCYRGICYERLQQHDLALADFDLAISLKPGEAIFHQARGRTHQQLGNLDRALADYNLASELKPLRASVYDDRAEIYRIQGDYTLAIADCNRAILLNRHFTAAYFRRGITHTELDRIDEALADFDRAIELEPQHIKSYIQRGWIYFRRGYYDLAIASCEEVLRLDKNCFWANYLLGIVRAYSGLKHQAIVSFTQAIELFPEYISASYHRGVIYYELGNIPNALADFDRARSIQERGGEKLIDRDETGFYAEGVALYYTNQLTSAHTMFNLAVLSAKRFKNEHFHEEVMTFLNNLEAHL